MRILLADDHDLLLESIKTLLERLQPQLEVKTAGTLAKAIELANAGEKFSVVLLDLNMPGMNGLEHLRETVEAFGGSSVAIITGTISRLVATAVLASGAKGFIPKTLEATKLVEAIGLLAAGETYVPPELMSGEMEPLGAETGGGEPLTAREREVAALLIQGFSNKEIARELDLQEVTVKLHVRNLCRKLTTKNRTQIAVRLMRHTSFL